jgi:hypothetical protein
VNVPEHILCVHNSGEGCMHSERRKTFSVYEVFKKFGLQNVYMRLPGAFFFGDFRGRNYDCALFEAFEFEDYKSKFSVIKRILEIRYFVVVVKYRERRLIKIVYFN